MGYFMLTHKHTPYAGKLSNKLKIITGSLPRLLNWIKC